LLHNYFNYAGLEDVGYVEPLSQIVGDDRLPYAWCSINEYDNGRSLGIELVHHNILRNRGLIPKSFHDLEYGLLELLLRGLDL
jgi:hypothetical protein